MGLATAVLASGGGGSALNTTAKEVEVFWKGRKGLIKKGTLFLLLCLLLVTAVKGTSSTTGSSTAISTSRDDLLVSCSHIIKIFPSLDMSVIWIDI